MAIRRPIVWNPSLRIYEQLQLADGLDVGDITLSISYLRSPIASTTLDLDGFDVNFISNGNTILKLIDDGSRLEMGSDISQVSGISYKRSFFKFLTTTTDTPTTFVYRKTTNCLQITGKCYAYNTATTQENLFDIDCCLIGESSITPITSTSESIIPIIQQTPNISLTFGVVSDIITFTIVGHSTDTVKWSFDFNIVELGQS